MGDDREPLSSEELIRRAREGYSPPRSDGGESRTSEPVPIEETPDEDLMLDEELEPIAETPSTDYEDLQPYSVDDRERLVDPEAEPVYEAEPPNPPGEIDPGPPTEDSASIEHPTWLPDTTFPGGTMPAPAEAPGGFARFFSIGRWVVGGIFLLIALGQCVGSETTLDGLGIGECFQDPGIGIEVSEVETVDCNELHDFELYATVALGPSDRVFPGTETLFTELESECVARFTSYVGNDYLTSAYDFVAFTPVAEGWRDGDRTGMCAIYEFGPSFEIVKSIGTARNSGR